MSNSEPFFLPNSLEKLFNFIDCNNFDCVDLRSQKKQGKIARLLADRVAQYFMIIGEHGSGSLICYWKYDARISWNQSPIVWLDSEGSPNSVFASNADEFLSLLPLGTGGIYDLISSWQIYYSEPEYYTSPLDKYAENSNALQYLIQICRENHSDYDLFIDWLYQNLNIRLCDNPAKLVGENIAKFPILDNWLVEKGH